MSYPQFGYTYPASSQLDGSSYDSRLLSFPRLASSFGHLYSYDSFYAHTLPYDLKESRSSWGALQQSSACYPYDPNGLASSYPDRFGSMESAARRKNASRETTTTLKAWLYEHRKNPYPTKGEKIMLAIITKMTLTQVSTWFANARRRLKKENKMTWEPRNKTSEGDDRDSSSPREPPDSSDNITEFLKQQETPKHNFSFEPGLHHPSPKSPSSIAKDSPFSLDCYRPQQHCSEEDSGGSESPGPSRRVGYFPNSKSEKDFSANSNPAPFSRPKIWSLARTATSDSPPAIRRSLLQSDFCAEDYPTVADAKSNCCDIKQAHPLSNCSSMFCCEAQGRKSDKLAYCGEESRKLDHQTHQMFCLETGHKVDAPPSDMKQVPFCSSVEDKMNEDLKQAQHQVPFYVNDSPPTDASNIKHLTNCPTLFCTDGGHKESAISKHQASASLNNTFCMEDSGRKVNSLSGCPTLFCADKAEHSFCPEVIPGPKSDCEMKCYRDYTRTSNEGYINPDRTRTKDPCRFTKCEAGECLDSGRGSCMMQPFATDFLGPSGVGDTYPRGRTLEPSYPPGGSRNEYFVPDRFDHAILISKGTQDVEDSQ